LPDVSAGAAAIALTLDAVKVTSQNQAIVDKGVGNGEPFATTHGAGEEKGASAQGEISNSSFGTSVVNFESTVCEAASEKCSFIFLTTRSTSLATFIARTRARLFFNLFARQPHGTAIKAVAVGL
jgi:hypothetical protein